MLIVFFVVATRKHPEMLVEVDSTCIQSVLLTGFLLLKLDDLQPLLIKQTEFMLAERLQGKTGFFFLKSRCRKQKSSLEAFGKSVRFVVRFFIVAPADIAVQPIQHNSQHWTDFYVLGAGSLVHITSQHVNSPLGGDFEPSECQDPGEGRGLNSNNPDAF